MDPIKYLSICSGIEAATVAWHPLGWHPVAFSEIEKFPSAVLAHHHPTVPNWGDMTRFQEWPYEPVDLLVGGTPCQDYSVAGLRAGMAGHRGALTRTYVEIAERFKPRWILWENVPGVFSSNAGRDFAALLCDLGACGYAHLMDSPLRAGVDAVAAMVRPKPRLVSSGEAVTSDPAMPARLG